MPSLPYWLSPGDDRPPEEIDDEVAEELRLHLDLLAEERMRQGVTPDLAKQQAAERFGDFNTLLRRCRLEKQGDLPMLKRIQAVLIGVLTAAVVAMGWQQWSMANQAQATWHVMNGISGRLSDINDKLVLITPSAANATQWSRVDDAPEVQKHLVVQIQDGQGKPLPNAAITTWQAATSRRGQFEFLGTSTSNPVDDLGSYQTTLPIAGFAAVAPGYAAMAVRTKATEDTSQRHLVALPPSVPLKLQVSLFDGSPARHSSVILARRTNLYDISFDFPTRTNNFRRPTDDDGQVTLDWLEPGDLVTLLVKERGEPIESATSVKFEVPRDPSKVVTIKLKEDRGEFRGGGEYGGGGFGGEFGGNYRPSKPYEVKIGEEVAAPPKEPSRQRRRDGGGSGGEYGGGGEFGGLAEPAEVSEAVEIQEAE